MGHKSTRITEQVYARIKDENLADRALDALDPRYARRSHRARGTRPPMNTITELPDPKRNLVFHEVQGERDSLTEWSKRTGIPKTTLHYRVVTVGMTMPQAIALGAGRRGKPLLAEREQRRRAATRWTPRARSKRYPQEHGGNAIGAPRRWRTAANVPQTQWKSWTQWT